MNDLFIAMNIKSRQLLEVFLSISAGSRAVVL